MKYISNIYDQLFNRLQAVWKTDYPENGHTKGVPKIFRARYALGFSLMLDGNFEVYAVAELVRRIPHPVGILVFILS